MVKRMLIDATHSEETRVAVLDGTKLEEFDVETSTKRQLKGNIYLAKVIRVEPSLQAAFIDYGGNRHGFLAFSEIHPDYYQIPEEDREELLALEQNEQNDVSEDGDDKETEETSDNDEAQVETITEEDDAEREAKDVARPWTNRRYKIQDVIKRKQILLVQVVKEERGNKGAAMTTYLSLAGRYCVLMPNNPRGGGVSRKITNIGDRKRLKQIVAEIGTKDNMSMIVRTAGSERTKPEIKRDYDYLLRLWENIRKTTLKSTSPCLIHEEANLIKRSIRDIYTRDIEEILVEGERKYRIAKDFMKMLTPSHAKKVQPYRDNTMPLFHRYQVENQIESLHSPIVQLKSGGYLVIDQTEALVAIDVNSGRSTKERNIEETALKTNLESAEEVARQLRLRDLAGLVVIDFIDMEEPKNNFAVERKMREALKKDRARIQMGKITGFGLMELSRQRLHPSVIQSSYHICPHCKGKGMVRSTESAALYILRIIEEEGIRRRSESVTVTMPVDVALYILNVKRKALTSIEQTYNMGVTINGDNDLLFITDYRLDRVKVLRQYEEDEKASNAEEVEVKTSKEDEIKEDKQPKRRRPRHKARRDAKEDNAPLENSEEKESGNEETGEEEKTFKPRRRRVPRRKFPKKDARVVEEGEKTAPISDEEKTEAVKETSKENVTETNEDKKDAEKKEKRSPRRNRYPRRRRTDKSVKREKTEGESPEKAPNTDKTSEKKDPENIKKAAEQKPVIDKVPSVGTDDDGSDKKKRGGWWQRLVN